MLSILLYGGMLHKNMDVYSGHCHYIPVAPNNKYMNILYSIGLVLFFL